MCFHQKKITAVLFLDYQYSMSANKTRINETLPTTNISNNNNFKIINRTVLSVKRKSPPFIVKLKTFLTNKEAWKHCSVQAAFVF